MPGAVGHRAREHRRVRRRAQLDLNARHVDAALERRDRHDDAPWRRRLSRLEGERDENGANHRQKVESKRERCVYS